MTAGTFNRRDWLKFAVAAGVASSAGAIGGCALTPRGPIEYRRPLSLRPFARPAIDMSLITHTRVGLRPYRASGFVVRGERIGDKVVVHNYGHGGGGITMSWGSAMLAVRELPDIADRRAAVLGCGVMGLTTARLLMDRGWKVTIYAKELPPNTTSDVAGGFWAPTSVYRLGMETPAFAAQFADALKFSHQTFSAMAGRGAGVNWIENYYLSRDRTQAQDFYYLDRWPELFPAIAELSPGEHPFAASYVLRHLSLLIEPAIFLPRLMREIREAGGAILQRELRADELPSLSEPVIFNCTGLGAKELFGDTELTPIRGQLAFMPADERIDYVTHGSGDGLLYMFPRADGILLGGAYERGATHLEPDAATTERIVNEHARMARAMRL
jgi:glycine/D-amino acid oxidase-like deaminating enzyme